MLPKSTEQPKGGFALQSPSHWLHYGKLAVLVHSHTWPLMALPSSHSSEVGTHPTKCTGEIRSLWVTLVPTGHHSLDHCPRDPPIPVLELAITSYSTIQSPPLPQPGPGLVLSQLPTGVTPVPSSRTLEVGLVSMGISLPGFPGLRSPCTVSVTLSS